MNLCMLYIIIPCFLFTYSTGTDKTDDDPVYASAPISLHTDGSYFQFEVPGQ